MTRRSYGWKRDKEDPRDHYLLMAPEIVPSSLDLVTGCPPVYDQKQLGSCTANMAAFLTEYDLKKQELADFTPSRLFIYYNTRVIEGTVREDSGASIRDSIKSIAKWGAPAEQEWPYNIDSFAKKPPRVAYSVATKTKAVRYRRVAQDAPQIKAALFAGYPVGFGFTVYESFESDEVARTGVMPMPGRRERDMGGHAVALVGYDDSVAAWKVRNSWGDWGQHGYFWMPYEYTDPKNALASDFWTVEFVG